MAPTHDCSWRRRSDARYLLHPYRIEQVSGQGGEANEHAWAEILHIRHHSLFAPRDLDMSPYFQIVKPTIDGAFDPHKLVWANHPGDRNVPAPTRLRAAS